MLQNNFMAESVNIENLDEAAIGLPIVQKITECELNRVMSNSFGFGGTNATLIFEKYQS